MTRRGAALTVLAGVALAGCRRSPSLPAHVSFEGVELKEICEARFTAHRSNLEGILQGLLGGAT